ncbi:MAG: hypothetical protein C7B46_14575 [Sulfobacillus benefaciens]|uniref:Uncharacterized protein n=1 Tax=Sulfobacillus benefaciens TaxID=453960 RepID=A0A2T2XCZ2_9FIRM|nr:MAG: hypothetical protein C7B46_14575 [Sulfobacillus benefaciens]
MSCAEPPPIPQFFRYTSPKGSLNRALLPYGMRVIRGKGLILHVILHRPRAPRIGGHLIFPRDAEPQRMVMHPPRHRILAEAFARSP